MLEEEVKKIVENYIKDHLSISISSEIGIDKVYLTVSLLLDDTMISWEDETIYLD
jgi:hypothetical protein